MGIIRDVLIGVVSSIIAVELVYKIPCICSWILSLAVRVVAPDLRERLHEEWSADLADRGGPLSKLEGALGFLIAGLRMNETIKGFSVFISRIEIKEIFDIMASSAINALMFVFPVAAVLLNAAYIYNILLIWAGIFTIIFVSEIFIVILLRSGAIQRRFLFIADHDELADMAIDISRFPEGLFSATIKTPAEFANFTIGDLRDLRIWGVLTSTIAKRTSSQSTLDECEKNGINVFDESQFSERILRNVIVEKEPKKPADSSVELVSKKYFFTIERVFDVVLGSLILFLVLPIFLATYVLLLFRGDGPVFDRSERIGANGHPFSLLKFRTFKLVAATNVGHALEGEGLALAPLGKLLRASRIDELPQLLNLLSGEVTLVGPRPVSPSVASMACEVYPVFATREKVKPGIVGWATLHNCYSSSVAELERELRYDLYYIKHKSISFNLIILLRVMLSIFRGRLL